MIAQQRKGIAFVICAPSGAGKTTLVHKLVSAFPRFAYSVSCTTRAPRTGEVDGKDYFFITKDEFLKRKEAHFFAEWAEVHGNCYGTPLKAATDMLEQGRDLLFDIDVQGAAQLKKTIPGAFLVFILPPSREELERRLVTRNTETQQTLATRLANAKREIAEATWFDALIVNDSLETAFDELRSALVAATLSPRCQQVNLENILAGWEQE